jgi:hypothetical protein
VCQVSSKNIDSKCLKSGGQKHLKGPLLGMPELEEFFSNNIKSVFISRVQIYLVASAEIFIKNQ